jgi:hypothetical protein
MCLSKHGMVAHASRLKHAPSARMVDMEQRTTTRTGLILFVAALGIRRVVEAYSKGGLLTNDQPEAQRKLL